MTRTNELMNQRYNSSLLAGGVQEVHTKYICRISQSQLPLSWKQPKAEQYIYVCIDAAACKIQSRTSKQSHPGKDTDACAQMLLPGYSNVHFIRERHLACFGCCCGAGGGAGGCTALRFLCAGCSSILHASPMSSRRAPAASVSLTLPCASDPSPSHASTSSEEDASLSDVTSG